MVRPGIQIKALRKSLNMTQKQLAELVKLDESMINKIENGHSVGSVQTLSKIAAALKVSITELLDDPCFPLENKKPEDDHA
ncbi:helix-turn-helix domain protein [Syntrophobotulus glycolicus DSM 8271]|uniref:Helix-turn-helix domain protein n=1 Tax=Syntrophobotulus glycolicus (strain DSM 8271 / FlGlyR) TaxID=645991 RepID=F0T1G6_SYNGF|nr:helix-turn-helix transcriptional regulator [Syntrophobotulus glycolicus]ADY56307.1 helix-turn-helix domain protein [Syntrophobotulus glycolicus DSM 8271]